MADYTKSRTSRKTSRTRRRSSTCRRRWRRASRARAIEGKTLGLSHFTLAPNFRIPFGHKHPNQEEVYVVVTGSARIKIEDEIVELASGTRADRQGHDAQHGGGPEGAEYIAFGAGDDPPDAEMAPGWWSD